MYRPAGQVVPVNVFTHIVAAAVGIVTPEMPRYIWAKIITGGLMGYFYILFLTTNLPGMGGTTSSYTTTSIAR
jgi:hypothetical protein